MILSSGRPSPSEKLAECVVARQLTLSGLKDEHVFSHISGCSVPEVKVWAGSAPTETWQGQSFTPLAQVLEVAGNFWVPWFVTLFFAFAWYSPWGSVFKFCL